MYIEINKPCMGLPVDCSYQPNLESYMTLNEDEYQKSDCKKI